jgi:hypothetical protein
MGVETVPRYRGTIYIGPLAATQKPGITNKLQFSSDSPMCFGCHRGCHMMCETHVRATKHHACYEAAASMQQGLPPY